MIFAVTCGRIEILKKNKKGNAAEIILYTFINNINPSRWKLIPERNY